MCIWPDKRRRTEESPLTPTEGSARACLVRSHSRRFYLHRPQDRILGLVGGVSARVGGSCSVSSHQDRGIGLRHTLSSIGPATFLRRFKKGNLHHTSEFSAPQTLGARRFEKVTYSKRRTFQFLKCWSPVVFEKGTYIKLWIFQFSKCGAPVIFDTLHALQHPTSLDDSCAPRVLLLRPAHHLLFLEIAYCHN